MTDTRRRCSICSEIKDLSDFGKDSSRTDGYDTRCKLCNVQRQRVHRKNNLMQFKSKDSIRHHRDCGYNICVSIKFVENLFTSVKECPICGTKFISDKDKTLDRINNESAIRENNIWIICNKCNTTKSNRTFKEFVEYCRNVVSRHDGKT
jgi:5-methylcytosine-specific restriction endonuclease McrA